MSLERLDLAGFEAVAPQWERLRRTGSGPFLTADWLASWWRAYAPDDELALVLAADDGTLLAGGCFLDGGRRIEAAVNAHSNDWGAVARDGEAESCFWSELAALGSRSLVLGPFPSGEAEAAVRGALSRYGYRLVEEALEPSPWAALPGSFEELLAARSRNLRSQVGRRRRRLEKEGELALRAVRGGPKLERDLDAFLALEAAGWKGRRGTAIAADPNLLALYRGFAERASAQGRLRLYLLELDGRPVAAEYGCSLDRCGFLVKTAFDESLARFAPGFVLQAAVLEASIEEGLTRYDFLGGPDGYKLRWADGVRPRTVLRAFRGVATTPAYAWRRSIRPSLKGARDRARAGAAGLRRWTARHRRAQGSG
ncbi:MAG TPA: GNAT family N-acetyltransferase [Solirubrobacterales bacterium]|nr:GNAT family N-acetyltransferase [Solirubrobacterales bacterium]